MIIPLSVYRLQFSPSYNFNEAQKIIPYLSDLGISCIYASPIFKTKKGATHGYAVVDPNQLNPELGSLKDFERLVESTKGHGISWLQDIVPNHMAYDSENRMLLDVMEKGAHSKYYKFFDLNWQHPDEGLRGRILAPFLGKFYSEALESGEIKLQYEEDGLFICYYEMRFPVRPVSYAEVLKCDPTNNPELSKLAEAAKNFENLGKIKGDEDEELKRAKTNLWQLYGEDPNIKAYLDRRIICFNGEVGKPESFDPLDALLSQQLYRLSFWKVATEEINYRRFFNINELISLNVQDKEVFEATHELIFRLIKEEKFDGLRIDHVDGLYDPKLYLQRLRENLGDFYLVVEKILEFDEELPKDWPVNGTTGYDFMNWVNAVFCRREAAREFAKTYFKFAGLTRPYDELLSAKKRLIIGKHMAGNIDNLAHEIKIISSGDRYGRDITLYGLERALVEIMAHFPVYRTFINQDSFSRQDQSYIRKAAEKARSKNPAYEYEINYVENILLQEFKASPEKRKDMINFIMRFQQYTAPLMAKGFEDTFLYIYNKLISLNEVGGSPNIFGIKRKDFHRFNARRSLNSPHTLNTTSTHDTKRGEDVRARINVLTEFPKEWKQNLRAWSRINKAKKTIISGHYLPDENDEYFLYQTILGALPFNQDEFGEFIKRIKDYLIKAVREAKVHTAWIKPDTEYEQACLKFIEEILQLNEQNRFLKDFMAFAKKISFYGIFNSLSQLLLKITSPGVPDFYQGAELWDLNLVDPDNRRPVDFNSRQQMLDNIKSREENDNDLAELMSELLQDKASGKIKLFLTYRGLKARKKSADIFDYGSYEGLKVEGPFKYQIVAFARKHKEAVAVTVVPRFLSLIVKEGQEPLGEVWQDTAVILPHNFPNKWKDEISGKIVYTDGTIKVADILEKFPAALLVNS
jgi:(1->4)-alpha-D-glucan 1-alpha-D-glucosylmutase